MSFGAAIDLAGVRVVGRVVSIYRIYHDYRIRHDEAVARSGEDCRR